MEQRTTVSVIVLTAILAGIAGAISSRVVREWTLDKGEQLFEAGSQEGAKLKDWVDEKIDSTPLKRNQNKFHWTIDLRKDSPEAIEPFGDEYTDIIRQAYEAGPKGTLTVLGSTYGLGARGVQQDSGIRFFDHTEISKLSQRLSDVERQREAKRATDGIDP